MKVLPLSITIVLILTVSSAWAAPWKDGGNDIVEEDAPTETTANEYDDDLNKDGSEIPPDNRSSDDEAADEPFNDEELTEDDSEIASDTRTSDDEAADEPMNDEELTEDDSEIASDKRSSEEELTGDNSDIGDAVLDKRYSDDEAADEPSYDEDGKVSANEENTVPS